MIERLTPQQMQALEAEATQAWALLDEIRKRPGVHPRLRAALIAKHTAARRLAKAQIEVQRVLYHGESVLREATNGI